MRNPLCNILAALFLSTAITIAISVRLNKDRTDVGLNRRPIARTGGEPVPLSADRGDRPLSPLGVRTSPADEPQPARDSGRRGPIDPEPSLGGAVAVFGNSGEPHSEPTIQRRVIIQDKTYRAFVYGRRL